MKQIVRWFFFKVLGWKIEGEFPANLQKYVVIVVPHTSWVDFPMGILIRYITGIESRFVGKESLFKGPFAWFFKALGGIPVNRSNRQNFVDKIVALFDSHETFVFSMSPEGTRKKVSAWKTGFYYIAKNAKVPLVKVALDYTKKMVRIAAPYKITDHKELDFKNFKAFFEGAIGKNSRNT
jgi:1-acyl-sn-glycerol-3-phosphate acyltransferase